MGSKAMRGFALLPPEERRRMAKKGGEAAHQLGVAHEWSPEEAQEAGRKGGSQPRRRRATRSETTKGAER